MSSQYRVEPVYEHFGVCGGCKWQNMTTISNWYLNKGVKHDIGKKMNYLNLSRFRKKSFSTVIKWNFRFRTAAGY
jgi:tRNA/tmRNA/rRNA uracil-C5-methylase (TrmA/RlmC/RlmD family)